MAVKTVRAGLFDSYRQFYGQQPDLPAARRYRVVEFDQHELEASEARALTAGF